VRRADNLTTFGFRLTGNLGSLSSWNLEGLSQAVQGLLDLFHLITINILYYSNLSVITFCPITLSIW
jgi:hypothetical protein